MFGLLLVLSSTSFAQGGPGRKLSRKQILVDSLRAVDIDSIKLTGKQAAHLQALAKVFEGMGDSLIKDTSLTPDQKSAKHEKMVYQFANERDSILTKAQLAKLDAIVKRQLKQMGSGGNK